MNLLRLVWRELWERKTQMLTVFLGIFLGIAALVAITNITYYSEKAVARELDTLGANVLILPKSVTLQDYYSADLHDEVIPEQYVTRLALSDIEGVDNLSPKLCIPVELAGRRFVLTGILPKSEFQAKAAWAGAGIFSRPVGCGAIDTPALGQDDQRGLVRKRVISTLAPNEMLVGADAAAALSLGEGSQLQLFGQAFSVVAVLPATGTVDDARLFAHLHTVQRLGGRGPVVSCIEIIGCCKEISAGMVESLNKLLPDAKVVTVQQIVATQANVNRMMERLSLVFVGIIVIVGGAGIANYMLANVTERRREIGTLMALGASSRLIIGLFLLKAAWLGLLGGASGYLVGTVAAVTLGPRFAGVVVLPMPLLMVWAVGISAGIALLGSYLPARHAARLDPVVTLQEI